MASKVQLRRDTYANWASANPTLAAGEQALETDTGLVKIGDGSTAYTSAEYELLNTYRLTANASAIGSAIADYFTNAAFTLDAAGAYEIIWDLYFLKSTAGTVTWTITSAQAPVNLVANYIGGPVAGIGTAGALISAGIVTSTATAAALPATSSLTDATNQHFIVKALVEGHATTAGTIKLRATESAGTITPLRGSSVTVRRLPAANIGAFA